MEDEQFWTKANRKTIVTRTELIVLNDGDIRRPPVSALNAPDDKALQETIEKQGPVWRLSVFFRTGFDQEQGTNKWFTTREEAEAAQARHLEGTEIDPLEFARPKSSEFDAQRLSFETEASIWGRGEANYFLVYEAMEGAGVIDSEWQTSDRVLSWVGSTGKEYLEARFGENWEVVAQLEYSVKHFDPTSLVALAARVQVADFISNRAFDAGYASRELEMLLGGAEQIAVKLEKARLKAGKKGAEASHARKQKNLTILLEEIEALSSVVGLISEERIVDQAFESVRKKHSGFPKSSKTRFDYETTLRSEEPFKSRYDSVFRKNA